MNTNHTAPAKLALVLLIGCGPGNPSLGDDEVATTDEGASENGDDPSDAGSSDATSSSSGTTDTDSSETDTSDSTTDDSTTDDSTTDEGSECEAEHVLCPDGVCDYWGILHACCDHGGECGRGCEPQQVTQGQGPCVTPVYAWDGNQCDELCPCEGSDCGATWSTPKQCLDAHHYDIDSGCGDYSFEACPFDDEQLAPTTITGSSPEGPVDLAAGTFGYGYWLQFVDDDLQLHLASTELQLANHLLLPWAEEASDAGIVYVEALAQVGSQVARVHFADDWENFGIGTLTITTLDLGDPLDPDMPGDDLLIATLEVDDGAWQLSGELTLHDCSRLVPPKP